MKPATVSASLAVISTASKYLHNDLARAIKALEQKKHSRFSLFLIPVLFLFVFGWSPSHMDNLDCV